MTLAWALAPVIPAAPADETAQIPTSRWAGDLLFISGTAASAEGQPVTGSVEAQTRQAVARLDQALEVQGLDRSRVVSLDLYLEDLAEFGRFWGALVEAFEGHLPSGAAVGVRLAPAGVRVQLAAVAARAGVPIRRIQPAGWAGADAPGSLATLAGDVLFVSGMAAFDGKTMEFAGGDIASQVGKTVANLAEVLAAAGMSLGDVSRCRVFLSTLASVAAMEEAWRMAWGTSAPPARTVVAVDLLGPGNLFGLQCVAARAESAPRFPSWAPERVVKSEEKKLRDEIDRGLKVLLARTSGGESDEKTLTAMTVYLSNLEDVETARRWLHQKVGSVAITFVSTRLAPPGALVQLEAVLGPADERAENVR